MNREQVIELARAAGFQTGSINQADGSFGYHWVAPIGNGCIVELERFAALVAAAEREACAELCAKSADDCMSEGNSNGEYVAMYLRDYIVARGQKKETK